MSPSPSQASVPIDSVRKGGHSRHNSAASPAGLDPIRSNKQQTPAVSSAAARPVHYTCIIRLPFDRNGFEDPPPVQWDVNKDKTLWKLISHASNSKDLNWEEMSIRFNVSLAFLLQQAAWLYERHFEAMKAQMKKLGATSMATGGTSPVNQIESAVGSALGAGGFAMQRTGSKGSRAPVMPPALQTNREITAGTSGGDAGSSPATPRNAAPPISRTPSTATVTQSKFQGAGHSRTQPIQRALRGSSGSERRPNVPVARIASDPYYEDAVEHEGPFGSDSEEEASALARSRAIRRAPLAKKPKPAMGQVISDGDAEDDDDDDDDSSGGYLPFATASSRPSKIDPAATLKGSPKKPGLNTGAAAGSAAKKFKTKGSKATAAGPDSPTSSASSTMHQQLSSSGTEGAELVQRPGPLSPRHRAQLASLSPRSRREGSEGSPSMGSSFSDLDDASVTQSALEDALMSNIRQGGNFSSMASRMSSLRDALGR